MACGTGSAEKDRCPRFQARTLVVTANGGNLFVTGGLLGGGPSHCDPTRGQREGAGVCSLHESVDAGSGTVGALSSSMRGCSENNGVVRVLEPVDKVGVAGDPLRGRR